ncbi:MAG TPA: hypothetical protein VLH10_21505 [Yinghuangia sp.]|nr:hypothetical protein [Yinghuangia sp.]
MLLYPMNALATDQAIRLNDYLGHSALAQVTAGLYIGDTSATGYERVATRREEMLRMPPDILITNYKMLDLLLQRGDDVPLWRGADLKSSWSTSSTRTTGSASGDVTDRALRGREGREHSPTDDVQQDVQHDVQHGE